MVKKIYLIRHGKIDTGNEKRYIGITDLILNTEGIKQAYFLKSYFSNISIDKVYTSPLIRCLQTTKIICEERTQEYSVVKEFKEINMGDWENKSIESIKKNYPQFYKERGENLEYFIPPEGENFHQLSHRVMATFDNIVHSKYENIMIVAHAGVNRVILRQILGCSMHDIFNIQQPYACVNELILNEGTRKWKYKQLM